MAEHCIEGWGGGRSGSFIGEGWTDISSECWGYIPTI